MASDTPTDIPYLASAACTAAAMGDIPKLEELASKYKDISPWSDYDARTPLHVAVSCSQVNAVTWLLDHGADVNAIDRWEGTPLRDAIRVKSTTIINLLKAKGAKLGDDATMATNLCRAAAAGDVSKMKQFIEGGADVCAGDYDKRTPLHLAASEGKLEAVKFLVESGADVGAIDAFGGSPLLDAIRQKADDVAAYLRSKGAALEKNEQLQNALCKAAAAGDDETVTRLLDNGADINGADYDGRTAIHIAASEGKLTVVKLMAARGADLSARDRWGATALADAQHHNYVEVVEFLKAQNASGGDGFDVEKVKSFGDPNAIEPSTSLDDMLQQTVQQIVDEAKRAFVFAPFVGCSFHALTKMISKNQDHVKELLSAEGLDLVVQALQRHSFNAEVKRHGFSLLARLAGEGSCSLQLATKGGLRAALEALTDDEKHTQREASCVLSSLGRVGDAKVAKAFLRERGITIVLEAVQREHENFEMIAHCMDALWFLLRSDETNAKRVESEDGLGIVSQTWKALSTSKAVTTACANMLGEFVKRDSVKYRFQQSHRGAELAVDGLKKFADDEQTTAALLVLLAALTIEPKDKQISKPLVSVIERKKSLPLVLNALRTFPTNPTVCEGSATVILYLLEATPRKQQMLHQIKHLGGRKLVKQVHSTQKTHAVSALEREFARAEKDCVIC